MFWLALFILIPLVVVVGGGIVLAAQSRRKLQRDNQVIPGIATRAPKSWVADASAEAQLHRRLRDIVAALRAIPGVDQPVEAEARREVEARVATLDDRLVAVAALPDSVRTEPLAKVTKLVEQLEYAVGQLANQAIDTNAPLQSALGELSEGLAQLTEANAELDALVFDEMKDLDET